MYNWSVVVLLASFAALIAAHSDKFTALIELRHVLEAENDVSRHLQDYVSVERQRLDELDSVAKSNEKHSDWALSNFDHYLSNPLNAFLLIKHFTTDWQKIVDLINRNSSNDFINKISNLTDKFPNEEDLQGAATALLRLQDTYALPTARMARGELQGIQTSPKLTAGDCFDLGRVSYNSGDHYHSILWNQQALMELDAKPEHSDTDRATVLDYLSFSMYSRGNHREALQFTKELLVLEPNHQRAQNNKKYYEQLIAEEEAKSCKNENCKGDAMPKPFKNERQLDDYRKTEEFQNYESLCRGESPLEVKDTHKLYCSFKKHHPYFYIRPLKEEVASFDPWIVVYHDLMTDAEMATIKKMAAPRLKRATVQNPQTGQLEHAFYRVSKSAWLRDYESRHIADVSARVHAMSNLTLDTAEELQVVNYGIGGHYEPHFDFARKDEFAAFDPDAGNRIATAIFYMTDVLAGGATVFPSIGVKLWPTKGSCAFWYNLLESGEGDYRTRHAGCPVLTGSKWVANKWIHERGQEFVRPCNLDPNL